MKRFFAIVALSLTTAMQASAQDVKRTDQVSINPTKVSAENAQKDNWLRNYSIPSQIIRELDPPFALPIVKRSPDEVACCYPSKHCFPKFSFLTRPDDDKRVGIIELNIDGSALLNPGKVNYAPLPALANISPEEAAQLWGNGVSRDEQTFALCLHKQTACFLDLVFLDNKLQKYRLRGDEITAPKWQIIR